MRTAEIETDAGTGYLKALGNPEGPHALASEFLGASIARMLGVSTPDFAIINLSEVDQIPLGNQRMAEPGPAFISRKLKAAPWGGGADELREIENQESIAGMVVLDTLLRNVDRYPPRDRRTGSVRQFRRPNYDNVLLAGKRIVAIDFGHALRVNGVLTTRITQLSFVRDEGVYGLFPAFREFVASTTVGVYLKRLRALDRPSIQEVVNQIPVEWRVKPKEREAVVQFLLERAGALHEWLEEALRNICSPQAELEFDDKEGGRGSDA